MREGHLEAARLLLDAGAEPDGTTFYGDSLIDIARDRGHEAIAALLEEASARGRRVTPSETHADHPIHLPPKPATSAASARCSTAIRRSCTAAIGPAVRRCTAR